MAPPGLTWFCAACGYQRGEQHTCPPDPQATIGSLVDALPRTAPSAEILEEIAILSLLRKHRFASVAVSKDLILWLLADRSFVELATEKLRPYTAQVMGRTGG